MQLRNNTLVTRDWARAIRFTQHLLAHREDAALARLVHDLAGTPAGAEPALIGTSHSLSYAQLSAQANRYARWALDEGFAAGDVVALDLVNQPEYVAIWLGFTQVGCIVALLNTNLGPDAKEHCLKTAGAKRAIDAANMPEIASLSGDPLGENERRPPRPKGSEHYTRTDPRMEWLVRRHDGGHIQRPALQLPPLVSQRRWNRCHRLDAGGRRHRNRARALLGKPFLAGRRGEQGNHRAIYWRTLSI